MTKTNAELAGEIELSVKDAEQYGFHNIVLKNVDALKIIAALRRVSVTDRGPQVVRYSHGNLYHEPEDIAKPVAEAEGRKG